MISKENNQLHRYNFTGGDQLGIMGASWFVSYYWYHAIDKTHLNWKRVGSYPNRVFVFEKKENQNYFEFWLEQILIMNENKLGTNEIGLSGLHIKQMASLLLQIIFDKSL